MFFSNALFLRVVARQTFFMRFSNISFSKLKIFSTVKRHKIEGNVLIAFTNAFDTEQTINTIKYDLISSADQNQCEERKTNFCILCNRTRVMRGKSKKISRDDADVRKNVKIVEQCQRSSLIFIC